MFKSNLAKLVVLFFQVRVVDCFQRANHNPSLLIHPKLEIGRRCNRLNLAVWPSEKLYRAELLSSAIACKFNPSRFDLDRLADASYFGKVEKEVSCSASPALRIINHYACCTGRLDLKDKVSLIFWPHLQEDARDDCERSTVPVIAAAVACFGQIIKVIAEVMVKVCCVNFLASRIGLRSRAEVKISTESVGVRRTSPFVLVTTRIHKKRTVTIVIIDKAMLKLSVSIVQVSV